jgi:hypothetical protein
MVMTSKQEKTLDLLDASDSAEIAGSKVVQFNVGWYSQSVKGRWIK